MLIFYSDDLTITGTQTFPETSDRPHIVVEKEPYALGFVLGELKLVNGSNGPELPPQADYDAVLNSLIATRAESLQRSQRDGLINAQMWRYERHAREVRLGLTPTDDINQLDAYIQALAEITTDPNWPLNHTWPTPPL